MFAKSPNLLRRAVVALPVAVMILLASTVSRADEAAPQMSLIPEAVIVALSFDENRVRKLLPAGLKLAPGATGQVAVYPISMPAGPGDFTHAYVSVDVEGFDSPSGIKGRYILAEVAGPAPSAVRTIASHGFPVRLGSSYLTATPTGKRGYVTRDGIELLSAEIRPKPEPCSAVAGSVNYVGLNAGSKLLLTRFSFMGQVCGAEPVNVQIMTSPSDPFGQIGPVKVLGAAMLRNLYVNWPLPESLE
jgi:hypothetical protein